jgi:hypothetical protein
LLDQRLSTVPQHQWLNKLFGLDFVVEYRPSRLNTVADALSRRDMEADPASHTALAISGPTFAFIEAHDDGFDDGLLLHGSRIYIPAHDDLRH